MKPVIANLCYQRRACAVDALIFYLHNARSPSRHGTFRVLSSSTGYPTSQDPTSQKHSNITKTLYTWYVSHSHVMVSPSRLLPVVRDSPVVRTELKRQYSDSKLRVEPANETPGVRRHTESDSWLNTYTCLPPDYFRCTWLLRLGSN